MKGKMRKLVAFMLATIMVLAMGMTASAQQVGTGADNTATITINNASKGETYAVYKLFSASVTGTEDGSIAYTGDIPDSLATYFTRMLQAMLQRLLRLRTLLETRQRDCRMLWQLGQRARLLQRQQYPMAPHWTS